MILPILTESRTETQMETPRNIWLFNAIYSQQSEKEVSHCCCRSVLQIASELRAVCILPLLCVGNSCVCVCQVSVLLGHTPAAHTPHPTPPHQLYVRLQAFSYVVFSIFFPSLLSFDDIYERARRGGRLRAPTRELVHNNTCVVD